jgi:hypothetical protein
MAVILRTYTKLNNILSACYDELHSLIISTALLLQVSECSLLSAVSGAALVARVS